MKGGQRIPRRGGRRSLGCRWLFRKARTIVAITVSILVILYYYWLHRHLGGLNTQSSTVDSPSNSNSTVVTRNSSPSRRDASCRFSISSLRDLQDCYPPSLVRTLPKPSCNRVEDWDDVQRCLAGHFETTSTSTPADDDEIQIQVHIVGERNSGTKFVMQELQRCFPRSTTFVDQRQQKIKVRVHRDFHRSKHFFQPILQGDYSKSVVVSVFRHAVEWTAAMREMPYHSPNHIVGFVESDPENNLTVTANQADILPLPWRDFVTREWSTQRSLPDLELMRTNRVAETANGDTCLQRFAFNEVVPCIFNESHQDPTSIIIPEDKLRGYFPLYELQRDGSGRSFANILALRSEKIVNFLLELSMLYNLRGYVPIRYEDLLIQGTRSLIEQVARALGLENVPEGCTYTEAQPKRLGHRVIPQEFRDYVNQHVDTKLERLLGYQK